MSEVQVPYANAMALTLRLLPEHIFKAQYDTVMSDQPIAFGDWIVVPQDKEPIGCLACDSLLADEKHGPDFRIEVDVANGETTEDATDIVSILQSFYGIERQNQAWQDVCSLAKQYDGWVRDQINGGDPFFSTPTGYVVTGGEKNKKIGYITSFSINENKYQSHHLRYRLRMIFKNAAQARREA